MFFDSLTKKNEIDPLKTVGIWETFDVKGYVTGFLKGDYDNNGFIVAPAELGGGYFRSSEYHDIQYRPKLELLISDNLSPIVNISSPIPEDIISSESNAEITWNGTDDGGINGFSLYYSLDYGESWSYVDSVGGLTDTYSWTTPKVNYKSRCYFKVIIYDDKWKSSEGQTYFWIDKATDNSINLNKLNFGSFQVSIGNRLIRFNVPEKSSSVSLKLKDLRGRLINRVFVSDLKNGYSFESKLTSGIYFIEIDGLEGYKCQQRVVLY